MTINGIRQADDELWYKDAVIYEVHVRAFQDTNGDGSGDFRGLRNRLPWLKELGVTCLWLLPFYPSPLRDDGYDIADYTSVHPDYGTLKDFRAFLKEAHRLGLKVITELVINHTSDQHPWFQRARRAAPGSAARNWYVWSDDPQRYDGTRIIFTDTEPSNWSWDPVAGQYFWHRFFAHQPDLNFDHPPVLRAVEKILRFWLDMGVDGMRLDAVPYLIEREGTNCENLPETHAILRSLRAVADSYTPRRIFLAEANQWPQDVVAYFGNGDECHMAYQFPLMPRLFMALAQEDAHPVAEILSLTPSVPDGCQWALFLRNHDELTLEMVTDRERDYMYRAYASDPRMRINVGIRRRLAPLVGNSRPRIELLNALLLSLPGTPVIYYGDEIGMGDNIWLGDRNGVRTPMQWSGDRNAGFSKADSARLFSPLVADGPWGWQGLNVESQERDISSLLHWMRRILSLRGSSRAFGRGTLRFVETSNRRILAYLREHEGETILVVANFSRHPQPASLQLPDLAGRLPVEMFGGARFPPLGTDDWPLSLAPHGFYWFRLESASTGPVGAVPTRRSAPSPQVVEVEGAAGAWWHDRAALLRLQEASLPSWLHSRPWYAGPEDTFSACILRDPTPLRGAVVAAVIETRRRTGGEGPRFAQMLAMTSGDEAETVLRRSPESVVARLRGADGSEGLLCDALAVPSGLDEIVSALRESIAAGDFRCDSTDADEWSAAEATSAQLSGRHPIAQLGDRILKIFPRLHPGPHPGEEILRHLQSRGFAWTPRVLGSIRSGSDGRLFGLLMERRAHQGKADERFRETCQVRLEGLLAGTQGDEALLPALEQARRLGQRVAELHACLAEGAIEDGFGTLPLDPAAVARLVSELHRRLGKFDVRGLANAGFQEVLASRRDDLNLLLSRPVVTHEQDVRIRCHGDLHLGQILWERNDFVFLDFEGEPLSPPERRRNHFHPAKDLSALRVSLAMLAFDARAKVSSTLQDAILDQGTLEWIERTWSALRDGYASGERPAPLSPPEAGAPLFQLHTLGRLLGLASSGRISAERFGKLLELLILHP